MSERRSGNERSVYHAHRLALPDLRLTAPGGSGAAHTARVAYATLAVPLSRADQARVEHHRAGYSARSARNARRLRETGVARGRLVLRDSRIVETTDIDGNVVSVSDLPIAARVQVNFERSAGQWIAGRDGRPRFWRTVTDVLEAEARDSLDAELTRLSAKFGVKLPSRRKQTRRERAEARSERKLVMVRRRHLDGAIVRSGGSYLDASLCGRVEIAAQYRESDTAECHSRRAKTARRALMPTWPRRAGHHATMRADHTIGSPIWATPTTDAVPVRHHRIVRATKGDRKVIFSVAQAHPSMPVAEAALRADLRASWLARVPSRPGCSHYLSAWLACASRTLASLRLGVLPIAHFLHISPHIVRGVPMLRNVKATMLDPKTVTFWSQL